MHVSALSGEYYILADLLRWLNVRLCADSAQVPFIRHWHGNYAAKGTGSFAFRSQSGLPNAVRDASVCDNHKCVP